MYNENVTDMCLSIAKLKSTFDFASIDRLIESISIVCWSWSKSHAEDSDFSNPNPNPNPKTYWSD